MAQNTINNQPRPQLSASSTNEVNLARNKTNSNFISFLRNVTPSFIRFFSLLFNCQSKHTVSSKKEFPNKSCIIAHQINKNIPTHRISVVDHAAPRAPSTHNGINPKEDSTENSSIDTVHEAELQTKAQRAEKTRKSATDNLQKSNNLLINNYDNISDIDRKKNHIINQLGYMISSHDNYSNNHGIFRIEGAKSDVDNLISKIHDPDTGLDFLLPPHNITLPTLTSAFKRIAGELLRKNNNIDFKSSISFNDLQACDDAVKNKENIIQQIKSNEQLKNKAPVILKNTDNRIDKVLDRLAPPPLTLELVTRFCALIANDEDTHRMSIKNLATIFAAHLTDPHSLDISTIKDAKKNQLEIMKEKEANQLAESYISALIHRERSLFHHV